MLDGDGNEWGVMPIEVIDRIPVLDQHTKRVGPAIERRDERRLGQQFQIIGLGKGGMVARKQQLERRAAAIRVGHE